MRSTMEVASSVTTELNKTSNRLRVQQLTYIIKRGGKQELFDHEKIMRVLKRVCWDVEDSAIVFDLHCEVCSMLSEGMTTSDIEKCCVLAAASFTNTYCSVFRDISFGKFCPAFKVIPSVSIVFGSILT